MEFNGFGKKWFGEKNSSEYFGFVINECKKEITKYEPLLDESIMTKSDLDLDISTDMFTALFKLYRKTPYSIRKYGRLDKEIDLSKANLSHEGPSIIKIDDRSPTIYLTEDSKKIYSIIKHMIDDIINYDTEFDEPFYFSILYNKKKSVTIRRSADDEFLGNRFLLFFFEIPESSIDLNVFIGTRYKYLNIF